MANETTRLKLLRQIAEVEENIRSISTSIASGIKDTNNNLQKQKDLLKDAEKELEKYEEKTKEISDNIKKTNKFLEDTEDLQASIADKVGKTHKLYKDSQKYIERQREGLNSIASLATQVGDANFSEGAEKAVEAYKKYQKSVASVADRTSFTGKQQEEANVAIARARMEYEQSVAFLSDMGEEGEFVLQKLNGMADETQTFGKAVTNTTKEWEKMDAILSSFSGIPAMGELNTLLKTNIRDTVAWKAAVFALGAALGKAAFDYFGAPIKAALQSDKEVQQNRIDGIAAVKKLQIDAQSIPKQIEQERLEGRINAEGEIQRLQQEAAFAGAKAAIQFSAQMQSGAAQFERAAKTALFGNKIGSVGYGAAQLQLAGISADKIASGMEAASAATGRMPSAKVGADMSIMAERTGTSVDNIASINEMFQRMDGASEATAMNLSEGLRNMADQANIGLGGLMKEIAEASKDALSYQIKSGPALAKQVAYAQSLGVSFGDIAKAGKSMVMNYKDSIKNEMQLSAMLGKNVDLSEVRAKFASGDTEGAMKSLQAQGLDPAQMDMFAQEQLSQALGGMDLNSLQKISTKKGADVGGLKEGKAGAANQDFLSRTQSAESAMSMKQASISASTAILDAKLSQTIADSYLGSDEYKILKNKQNLAAQEAEKLATSMAKAWKESDAFKEQLAATTQLDFVSGLKETLLGGAAAVLGGIGTSLVDKFAGKAIGSVKGMFGKGGAHAGAAPAAAGGAPGASPMASAAASGADALVPGAGGVVESITSQVDAVQAPLEKAMTMGQQLKDLGKGIGGFLQSVGQGVGKAIQGIMMGLGAGVRSLGQAIAFPTPIGPAGLAVAAFFIALAGAMWLAEPAFTALAPVMIKIAEVIGNVLVEALKQAGPIITSIFEGIGTVINSIGNAIATVITAIANSLALFATMDAANLLAVAGSVTALSAAVALFGGASIIGAVGSFFGGGVFDDLKDISSYANPIQMTADAVQSLANAFASLSSIDTSSLKQIPWGDMEDFASEGGKFVLASSGGGSFALSKDTTDNIKKMATNTDAMVKLNNTMAKLLKEGFFGSGETSTMKLYIDGKDVNSSMTRYKSNTENQDPKKK